MSDETKPTTRRGRSPNYPGIDIKQALDRANVLWEKEQHHAVPDELILRHWGYSSVKSGSGQVTYAALKRFGLLEAAGSGRARLSNLAQTILLGEREGRREYDLIRQAALLPSIHTKIWSKYGASPPSDETFKFELTTEDGFTQAGAGEFIRQWKRTMAFAGLAAEPATVSDDNGDTETTEAETLTPPTIVEQPNPPGREEGETSRLAQNRGDTRTVQITYSPDEWALLQGRFPLSEEDWDAMIAVLQAMKRGLVAKPE